MAVSNPPTRRMADIAASKRSAHLILIFLLIVVSTDTYLTGVGKIK